MMSVVTLVEVSLGLLCSRGDGIDATEKNVRYKATGETRNLFYSVVETIL